MLSANAGGYEWTDSPLAECNLHRRHQLHHSHHHHHMTTVFLTCEKIETSQQDAAHSNNKDIPTSSHQTNSQGHPHVFTSDKYTHKDIPMSSHQTIILTSYIQTSSNTSNQPILPIMPALQSALILSTQTSVLCKSFTYLLGSIWPDIVSHTTRQKSRQMTHFQLQVCVSPSMHST